jgi:hypothetical protein
VIGDDRMMTVTTELTADGVMQTRDIFGEITRQYANLCAMQMDAAIREKLIQFGWTPPETTKPPA